MKVIVIPVSMGLKYLFAAILCPLSLPVISQVNFEQLTIDDDAPVNIWGKTLGDLNGDGLQDIIVGGNGGGGLVWYENSSWTKHTISASGAYLTDHETADVDNDGDIDVVSLKGNYIVWYNNPDWTETVVASIGMHDLELADINNDNKIDIIARNQGEFGTSGTSIEIYTQSSPTSWLHSSITCPDGEGLVVYDLNKDDYPDIIVNTVWYENQNGSSWEEHTYTNTWTHQNTYIAIGDINGDGREDIACTPSELESQTYHISWFEQPSELTDIWKENIVDTNVEAVHHFVGLADFNLDNQIDIVTAEMTQGADPDEIKIYYNSNNGISWKKDVLATTGSHSMRLFDYDLDGDIDLFGANWNDNVAELWINTIADE